MDASPAPFLFFSLSTLDRDPMRRLLIPALVALTCACSNKAPEPAASSDSQTEPEPQPEPGPTTLEFNRDPSGFNEALAALDEEITKTEALTESQTGWLVVERVAKLYMSRARLSGSYQDYAKAEAAIAASFERAPEGSGPFLTRAALNFTLHRLDPIEADLAKAEGAILVDKPTQAYIASVRGDVAFQRGEYAAALDHYETSLGLQENSSILAKIAQWRWRAGEFELAEQKYREAEAKMLDDSLEARAWLQLQIGIMDLERGRYEDAFGHYREGTEILGGWWLLEEHIAEIAVLLGLDAFALELYTDIIERTGKGEFMDAKAALLGEAGDEAGAQALIDQASGVYESQLELFPEASYGHALDHYLEFGPAARALELAELNHGLRPGVPAKIALAEARLATSDTAGAQAIIDTALATTWVSADLFWAGSQVYAALGDEAKATELREQAEALHPTIATD